MSTQRAWLAKLSHLFLHARVPVDEWFA